LFWRIAETGFFEVVLWGLHMGATQDLLSILVVDPAPADLRGIALGRFNLITGGALLAEKRFGGLVMDRIRSRRDLHRRAVFAGIALLGMLSKAFSPKAPNGRVPR
jgi:hypothetical protein